MHALMSENKRPGAKRPVGDQHSTPSLTSRGQDGGPNPVAGYGHPNTAISGPAPPRMLGDGSAGPNQSTRSGRLAEGNNQTFVVGVPAARQCRPRRKAGECRA